ncbi:SGNH/GDSL hydrolase family protein [Tianweitania sp. BSSL-BM11]|uniref:SGNH/GDSL hydrolase family protein n=1 Tax=Tianweitania aestuarii TaxID=2814886 RepID=A0ABS5RUR8_9HYPH|nr:SGNH/GDSL hydrolase family protein [Tianweitania aestuarii]MBS9720031.1 SGNH/GDSL hydrolase family protein [Tianweitania aestuarii]
MADTPFPLPRGRRETAVLNGNGGTVYGPFAEFGIFDPEDVKVWAKPAGAVSFLPVGGVVVTKAAATVYSTFTVTFPAPVPPTTKFVVRGHRTPKRDVSVLRGGSVSSQQLEAELSRIAATQQEQVRDAEYSWQSEPGKPGGYIRSGLRNHVAVFDADGNIDQEENFTVEGFQTDVIETQQNRERAEAADENAAFSALQALEAAKDVQGVGAVAANLNDILTAARIGGYVGQVFDLPLAFFQKTGLFGAYYNIRKLQYLFQDLAGTVPVTGPGQPVGVILDLSGHGMHLIAVDDASRGTLVELNGTFWILTTSGVTRYRSAASRTVRMPCYINAAVLRDEETGNGGFLGFAGDSNNRFQIVGRNAQNRAQAILRNAAHGQVAVSSEFEEGPLDAVMVIDTLATEGLIDIGVNNAQPRETLATSWTAASASAGAERYVLNINSLTGAAGNKILFGGGMIVEGNPGNDRDLLVDFWRRQCERPAATTDINILVISDSTGDAQYEWVFLFAQWLATQYPSHFVGYRLFNNYFEKKKQYSPEITVSNPAKQLGAIRIYNAAIAGSQPSQFMGDNFQPIIAGIPRPNVIIWNHGYNIQAKTAAQTSYAGQFMGPMDQVRLQWPGVPHMAIRQPPLRDNNNMAPVVAALDFVAGQYGDMLLADVHTDFINAGKPAAWYNPDGLHPSETGAPQWLPKIQAMWTANFPQLGAAPAFSAIKGTNLLSNGKFADLSGGVPAGWTKIGDGAIRADASHRFNDAPYSVRIANGAGAATGLRQIINAVPLRGLTVTLRVVIDIIAPGLTAGRLRLSSDGAGAPFAINFNGEKGGQGFRMMVASLTVPANATAITVDLLAAEAAGADGGTIALAEATLVAGNVPRAPLS